jgi:hypothetical protein
LTDATAIQRAIADGTLARDETVTVDGTLVLELRMPGLGAAVADAAGSNATARLDALLAANGTTLDAVQENPTVERTPLVADLVDPSATRVVRAGNDTVYLALETAEIPARRDGDTNWTALESTDYEDARFGVTVTHGDATASTEFVTEEPAVEFVTVPGSEQPYVRPAPNATVRARTNLAPGTNVTVSVLDAGKDVVREATATVDADRRLSLTYNLSEFRGTIALSLVPSVDDRRLDSEQATVAQARAAVTLNDQRRFGQRVTVAQVTLSHGGVLAIHRGSPDGPVVAQTLLPVGSHTDLDVEFSDSLAANATLVAVPYRDVNGNGVYDADVDQPYNTTAVAAYTVEPSEAESTVTPSPTATVTPSSTPTATPRSTTETDSETSTEATTRTPTATTATETTSDDGPGFGGAVALLALLAGSVVAKNRRGD